MSRCKSKIKLLLMLQLFGAISALAIEASSRHQLAPLGTELNQISPADVQGEGRSFLNASLKIINGYDAKLGDFPFYVSVRVFNSANEKFYDCGGTILSPDFILTAAHCVKGLKVLAVQPTVKYPGSLDRANWIPVAKACVHKNYKPKPFLFFDVAVLKLERSIKFSEHVQSVNLPTVKLPYGAQAYTVGLGLNDSWAQTKPETLQVLPVERVHCPVFVKHYSKLCIKPNQQRYIGGTCDGDSGGPLVKKEDGKQTIFGVTSSGISGCPSGSPSVFADVYNLRGDINDLVRKCL